MQQIKHIIMTLALLMTAAGAWAAEKQIGLNVEYGVYDVITSTTDVYVFVSDGQAIMITSSGPATIDNIDRTGIGFHSPKDVYNLSDGSRKGNVYSYGIDFVSQASTDPSVVHVASGNGTLANPYVFAPGGSAPEVTWNFEMNTASFDMPAGNVLLNVAYKDRTATTVKFGETTITPENNSVKGYIGFEAAFASQIAATVQNIEQTFNQGQAVAVADPTFTYKSNNTDVIAFQADRTSTIEYGSLSMIKFNGPGTATLTVEYTGTADLSRSKVDLSVTVAYPVTLTLATNDVTRGTVEAVVPKPVEAVEFTAPEEWKDDNSATTSADLPQLQSILTSQAKTWTDAPTTGIAHLAYAFDLSGSLLVDIFTNGVWNGTDNNCSHKTIYDFINKNNGEPFYYTTGVNPVSILAGATAGTYKVIPGTEVTLKIKPTEGNELTGWSTQGLTDNEDGTWTVTVGQTTTLTANFAEKTYTVAMAPNTADAAKWQGSLDGGQSYADLPIVSVKNNPVTLKYNGRLKVKSVTATHDGENVDETTVKITTSDISEGDASVVFNVQLSKAPQGEATVQVKVGETTFDVAVDASGNGVLTLDNANDDDPYLDASTITAEVVGVTGGNYENVVTGQKATAIIRDTINGTIVSITGNNFHEGDASVVFNVFFSNATLGEATVQVKVGNTIHNVIFSAGISTETLTLDNPHTSSVTAEIVGVTGGFFENIVIDGQKATAYLE